MNDHKGSMVEKLERAASVTKNFIQFGETDTIKHHP